LVLIEGCDDDVREVKKRCSLVFLVGEKWVLVLIEWRRQDFAGGGEKQIEVRGL
jgi:hypothetical protein